MTWTGACKYLMIIPWHELREILNKVVQFRMYLQAWEKPVLSAPFSKRFPTRQFSSGWYLWAWENPYVLWPFLREISNKTIQFRMVSRDLGKEKKKKLPALAISERFLTRQFSSGWYLGAWEETYVLCPFLISFPSDAFEMVLTLSLTANALNVTCFSHCTDPKWMKLC